LQEEEEERKGHYLKETRLHFYGLREYVSGAYSGLVPVSMVADIQVGICVKEWNMSVPYKPTELTNIFMAV